MKTEYVQYDNTTIRAKINTGEFKVTAKRSRSRVWDVFSRIVDQNGIELKNVICRTCPSVFRFHGSTSNLVRHKCYKNAMEDYDSNEVARVHMLKEDVEYSNDSMDPLDEESSSEAVVDHEIKDKLAHAISDWTVENCRPFNIAEDSGLKKLAALLVDIGANYGSNINMEELLPHTAIIASNVETYYQDALDKVRTSVWNAKTNGYSITCDNWMDNYLRSTNLCLTIHYIKDDTLVNRLLAVTSLNEVSCTGLQLKTHIDSILNEFNCKLDEDQPIFVTPVSANLSHVLGEGHIRCINDLLNNAIERTFNEVSELKQMLSQTKEVFNYLYKVTYEMSDTFLNLKNQLISYSPNKWNSLYELFFSIEINWKTFNTLLQNLGRQESFKINDISSIVNILGHFEKCSKILENDTSPTLHLVIPHMHRLKKICSSQSTNKLEKDMKLSLKDSLESLAKNEVTKFHKMALFLFPPTNQLLQCTQAEKDETIEECKILMKLFCPQEIENIDMNVKIKQEFDDLFSDFVTMHSPEDGIDREIRLYSDVHVPLSDGYDVLNWWYSNKDKFPLLYRTSCRILGTPATSATSKKALAQARNLLNEPKTNTPMFYDDVVNKIMFLHNNSP